VSQIVSVGIGAAHACVVRANGTIECRGNNDKGQATPPPGLYYQVVAGALHTCAQVEDLTDRTKDKSWVCWGDNTYGQATAPPGPRDMLSAGGRHTCASATYGDAGVADNATIVCWGDNSLGQLSVPPGTAPFPAAIAAGKNHTCALTTSSGDAGFQNQRSVACWGDNSQGQSTPPADFGRTPLLVIYLAAGGDHTCASDGFGYLTCWGANDAGQSAEPVGGMQSLSLATGHSCAIVSGGRGPTSQSTILCWGSGWGTSLATPPPGKFNNVFAGDYMNCAQTDDMTQPLQCWGQKYEPWY
jgi:hypothetical protein